jgi:hypothetical protein
MCGYGLHNVKSRRAKVGDKLTARNFGTGTPGSLQAPHQETGLPLHLCQDSFGNWIVARCLVRGARECHKFSFLSAVLPQLRGRPSRRRFVWLPNS